MPRKNTDRKSTGKPSLSWTLDRLTDYCRKQAAEIVYRAWLTGQALDLIRAKLKAEGRAFDTWVRSNECPFSRATAYRFIRVYQSIDDEEDAKRHPGKIGDIIKPYQPADEPEAKPTAVALALPPHQPTPAAPSAPEAGPNPTVIPEVIRDDEDDDFGPEPEEPRHTDRAVEDIISEERIVAAMQRHGIRGSVLDLLELIEELFGEDFDDLNDRLPPNLRS